ncbi:MAG: hypothetical protein V2A79_05710 [Planctomycetota bacterium]
MAKKVLMGGLLVVACGSMLGWGGCLGGNSWWGYVIRDAALSTAYEFVLDNDSVFDLFQDDFGTGALYDDRNVAAPSREEP